MAKLGIGRTFQNVALCAGLSVRHNIMLGAHCQQPSGFLASLLRLPEVSRSESRIHAMVDQMLHQFGLESVANEPCAGLPFGTRKKVELARALASKPKLLLLD